MVEISQSNSWMHTDEAAAIEMARAGDRDAFRTLVEQHGRNVFRVAWRLTGNEQDAEDMVQETFLKAYRQIAKFDGRAQFATWITRIAVNCSLDLLRARQRRGEAVEINESIERSPGVSPEQELLSKQIGARLQFALGKLSPAERAAFILRHYEGAPIEEIARTLAKPAGATRHCIFRAVQKLREALAPFASPARACGRPEA
ncbi:MAG TPA: sigma-70 family RNA polymerase sigma factor [Bryobacteraceae bacterium]|nr:sigma-70 family RNA polymerase sigma factor [Bryobacteraceae bacterium]